MSKTEKTNAGIGVIQFTPMSREELVQKRERLNHVWLAEWRLATDAVGAMSSDEDRGLLIAADAAWLPIWEKLLAGELTVSRESTEDDVRGLVDVKAIPAHLFKDI